MLRFKNIASFNGKMGIFVDDYWAFFTRIRAWQERHYPLFHNFLILNNESGLIYFQKDVDPPEEELIKMKKIFSNPLWKNEEYADKGDLFWSARASFNTRNFPFKGLYIMPFGVNKEVIINLLKENIEPKFDILLDGKLKSIQYGFRRRLVDIVQQNKFRWKVFDTFKPDVNMKKYLGGGNQYYKNILRCHFIISDTGDYNISARKYFEIGALGRTPIGNQTGFEEHNLVRKNIVELNEDMSQEKIENIINLAIDQKNDYLKKAKKLSNEYIHAYDQKKIVEELIDNLS